MTLNFSLNVSPMSVNHFSKLMEHEEGVVGISVSIQLVRNTSHKLRLLIDIQ